ncbi:MAG: hemolysin III family protein [Patescibacteria group bacterium]
MAYFEIRKNTIWNSALPNDQKSNEIISSLTHFIGAILSVAGLVLLIVFSSLYGNATKIVGFSVFGAGLTLLYFASAIYHFISKGHRAKPIFKIIDYSMIYVLIASTYTPLMLAIPERSWGWSMFGIVWGMAFVGIMFRIFQKTNNNWFSSSLFIFMGWLAVIIIPILLKSVPLSGLWWLIIGGIFYTVGVIFFALEKKFPRNGWFGMHEIFHLFVMAGSFSHFWFMFKYVLYV